MLLKSFAMNKVEFVKMFIDFGLSINSILTKDQLAFLYYYVYFYSEQSLLQKLNPELGLRLEATMIADIQEAKCSPACRMDLQLIKTYLTENVCTNTMRDDNSFMEVVA